ncbi:hypothetical protein ABB02_01314 [Clostridiaceae bacterium JG1575]|nr:hypothetical protein ABB02_01314 [Clostridiaceae bacterium JG1575]
MGKSVKITLVLTLLIGVLCIGAGLFYAKQNGLGLGQLTGQLRENFQKLDLKSSNKIGYVREARTVYGQVRTERNLLIRNGANRLTISPGPEFAVSIWGDLPENQEMGLIWQEREDLLVVDFQEYFKKQAAQGKDTSVLLQLPQKEWELLQLNNRGGAVKLQELTVQQMEMKESEGQLTLEGAHIEKLSVQGNRLSVSGAGEVQEVHLAVHDGDIQLKLSKVKGLIHTNKGKVMLQLAHLSGNLKVQADEGPILLSLPQREYQYRLRNEKEGNAPILWYGKSAQGALDAGEEKGFPLLEAYTKGPLLKVEALK